MYGYVHVVLPHFSSPLPVSIKMSFCQHLDS